MAKLFEKAKSVILLVIATIVLLAFCYHKFVYEPDKLKETVRDQSNAITVVQETNTNLIESIKISKESEALKELIVEIAENAKAENEKLKAEEHAQIETKVDAIKEDFAKQIEQSTEADKTIALIKSRERAISKTRIESLWKIYCQTEPNELDCKDFK